MIKKLNKFTDIKGLDNELDNITRQALTKDEALIKNKITKEFNFYVSATSGGTANKILTLAITNGQVTKLELK